MCSGNEAWRFLSLASSSFALADHFATNLSLVFTNERGSPEMFSATTSFKVGSKFEAKACGWPNSTALFKNLSRERGTPNLKTSTGEEGKGLLTMHCTPTFGKRFSACTSPHVKRCRDKKASRRRSARLRSGHGLHHMHEVSKLRQEAGGLVGLQP